MTPFRKMITVTEQAFVEDGGTAEPAGRTAVALAVMQNPWAGEGPGTGPSPSTGATTPGVAALLAAKVMAALGGPVGAWGAKVVIGAGGEVEHGSALVQVLGLEDALREAAGAPAQSPVVAERSAAGATFDIPLRPLAGDPGRSDDPSVEARVADAPRADEVVIGLAASLLTAPPGRHG